MRIEITYRWFLIMAIVLSVAYLTTTFGGYHAIPYFGAFFVIPSAVSILVYDWHRSFDK